MDTAWIQVFVLSLAECVAPAGKTVCQEQQLELAFASERDCEVALEAFLTLKEASPTVIVDRTRSRCTASAREVEAYASLEAIEKAHASEPGWSPPSASAAAPVASSQAHRERLDALKSCEETDGQPPCKVGEIILEAQGASKPVEVWRRD
jgi:hypothetical protein